jgi:hypothetical protein
MVADIKSQPDPLVQGKKSNLEDARGILPGCHLNLILSKFGSRQAVVRFPL